MINQNTEIDVTTQNCTAKNRLFSRTCSKHDIKLVIFIQIGLPKILSATEASLPNHPLYTYNKTQLDPWNCNPCTVVSW